VCERVGIGWRAWGKGRLCHIGHMKVVSIRELHEHTGELVRHALKEPILVTDRGQQVAVLKSNTGAETSGKLFPKRKLSSLPKRLTRRFIFLKGAMLGDLLR